MTRNEIVGEIARSGIVETLITSMKASIGEDRDNLKDLSQDIYMDLLSKPEELLLSLWESGEYKFYIARMIINNVCSSTSAYDKTYRRKIIMPEYEGGLIEDAEF